MWPAMVIRMGLDTIESRALVRQERRDALIPPHFIRGKRFSETRLTLYMRYIKVK